MLPCPTETGDAAPRLPRQAPPPAVPRLPSVEASLERIERRVARARREHAPLALMALALGPVTAADGSAAATEAPALALEFTRRLRARLRGTDDLWQHGPGEWVALLVGCRPDGARAAARRLGSALGAPYALAAGLLLTRPRIGLAHLRVDGDTGCVLLAAAQAGLDFEEARAAGRRFG